MSRPGFITLVAIVAGALMGACGHSARATSWFIREGVERYHFRELECELSTKSDRPVNGNASYVFKCSRNGKTAFEKVGFGADKVEMSPSGRYLIGYSNSKLSHFAFWIVGTDGQTIQQVKFSQLPELKDPDGHIGYISISTMHEWLHSKGPDVRFLEEGERLLDISVRDHDGHFLSLRSLSPFYDLRIGSDSHLLARFKSEVSKEYEVETKRESEQKRRNALELERNPPPTLSMLMNAAEKGDLTTISKCVDAGIQIDGETRQIGQVPLEKFPLFAAVESRKIKAAALLISKGAKVDFQNREGVTPLSVASFNGYREAVELLLASGAKLDLVESRWGWTPLMRAARNGHAEVVKLLLSHGASKTTKDRDGKTAYDHAHEAGQVEVARLLRR